MLKRSTVNVYKIDSGRSLGSGVRVSVTFQKIPRLDGRLGSGPSLVGRLWSGIRASASFQKHIPRFIGLLRSGPRVVDWLGSGVWLVAVFKFYF